MFKLHLSLLIHISLSTTLTDLALIMLVTVLLLLSTVTSNSSTDRTKRTLGTVLDSLTPVLELALGFLFLACGILLFAGLAQVLVTDQVADGFFGGAESLVPGAVGALGVVLGYSAGVGVGRHGANLGGCVRGVFFGFADFLLGFALVLGWVSCCDGLGCEVIAYLGGGIAGDGTSGTLGEAGGLVKVGLAGGRVAVRHDGCGG